MEKLKISADRHHFVTADGTPFFWLADTAWTITQRLKWDDVDYYMEKRRSQGFTVLQIVALDPERDLLMRSPSGDKALLNDDLSTPNEEYFKYLDYVLDRAEFYGFYVLLLPVWGQLVTGDNWGGKTFKKIVDEENGYIFGEWIGRRYRGRTNLLWCLGGDRHPIHKGCDYRQVWRKMAEGLAKGYLGKELHCDESAKEWEDMLLTYHTCYDMTSGRCSTWDDFTAGDQWISFTMLQSGHSETAKNFAVIEREYNRQPAYPVFDGEPAYEKMPKCWPPTEDGLYDEAIVRKRAYWALFSGAFGHTYGHSSVWCMIAEKERSPFRPYSWYEALDQKGAWQMKYLRDLADSRPFHRLEPRQALISHVCDEQCYLTHRQACITKEETLAFIYLPNGGTEQINLSQLKCVDLKMWWWNPRDGKCYDQENEMTSEPFAVIRNPFDKYVVQAPESGTDIDWVLLIEEAAVAVKVPGESIKRQFGSGQSEAEEKVFDW